MICERKDRLVDRTSVYRSRLQQWQDPHAAPTAARLFEQYPPVPKNKRMLLGDLLCARPWFFDWQRCRIFCAAEFFDGTDSAFRPEGEANKSAEIDKRGVVRPSVGFWNKTRCTFPERFSACRRFDRSAKIEKPRQNASSVRLDDWD